MSDIIHSKQVRKDVTNKKIVYIDMDGVMCDFAKNYREWLQIQPEREFPQSRPGFFTELEPIEGAIDTIKWLDQIDSLAVFILTAPSIKNVHCYAEKRMWVERYLGMEMVGRLIISGYKHLNRGDYLIDDAKEGRGQEDFEGTLLLFGGETYPDWKAIEQYFRVLTT